MRQLLLLADSTLKSLLGAVIKIYRITISPLLGNHCRFYPSCSQYALDTLKTKTFFSSLLLIVKRVAKCHPFHSGGYDPVK